MNNLSANTTEEIALLTGENVRIPKCVTTFGRWRGTPVQNTYGGKMILTLDSAPLFAELVVLRLLAKRHWQGVWVDCFGGTKYRVELPEVAAPVELKQDQRLVLETIRSRAGCKGGCFDVFAWRGNEHRFVELKRAGKDHIKTTQKRWLAAALDCGVRRSELLIVEWDVDLRRGHSCRKQILPSERRSKLALR